MYPIVELSSMPRALASGTDTWMWYYGSPANHSRWRDLARAVVEHCVERYGAEEVGTKWYFEVWNEPSIREQRLVTRP